MIIVNLWKDDQVLKIQNFVEEKLLKSDHIVHYI